MEGAAPEREAALANFLEARARDGYVIETHTATHAVIAPGRWLSLKQTIIPFRKLKGRQVISVDDRAVITMRAAEPVRY
jgi:hypothetical protein